MNWVWVFLNGDRGDCTVRHLANNGHKIAALVTTPAAKDKIAPLAAEIGATLEAPNSIHDTAFIRSQALKQPGLGIVAGFSTIFREATLSLFEHGIINLHAGKVPEYRGGSPLNWQLINGEREFHISVLKMTGGIDDGPVLASKAIAIAPTDDIAELHSKANAAFPGLVSDVLDRWWSEPGIPQTGTPRYWLQRNDADGEINWNWSADYVCRFIRALTKPYPGAHSDGVRIWKAEIPSETICGAPGRVAFIQGRGPYVCCSDRAVLLLDYRGEIKHGQRLRLS